MYEKIDDGRLVVARKDHRCEWCAEPIHKGEKCIKRIYKFDGDLWNTRQHPECFDAMKRDPYSVEGFCPGEQRRGMRTVETEEAHAKEFADQ